MKHLDPCPCGGTMRRYKTVTSGNSRVRYLSCDQQCGEHGKETIPVDAKGRILYGVTPPGNTILEIPILPPKFRA